MDNSKPSAAQKKSEPTIAPGMEMDELKKDATPEDIKNGNVTQVTRLVLDRTPDD